MSSFMWLATTVTKILIVWLLLFLICSCSPEPAPLFVELSSGSTKIDFKNTLPHDSVLNILDYNYFYNGGGVGVGDFNGDGLADLYFTGNMVSSRLYLNRGNFEFEDVTEDAGVGTSSWATGVAIADVNNDNLPDIYVSCAGLEDAVKRRNILFLNKGSNSKGIPIFHSEAGEWGVADSSYTTQALFFDYDKDGYLDLILANHFQDAQNPNYPRPKVNNGGSPSNPRLYKNIGHKFVDVSLSAGFLEEGYTLGVGLTDFNNDGWPDIYMSKDFVYDDAVYINNQDGSFTERISEYLLHTSRFSMGCDIGDLNNDC